MAMMLLNYSHFTKTRNKMFVSIMSQSGVNFFHQIIDIFKPVSYWEQLL